MPYHYLERTVNNDVLLYLEKLRSDSLQEVVIITNAPESIAIYCERLFRVRVLRADIGKKYIVLNNFYIYKKLNIVTDNVTDIDVINVADSAILLGKHLRKRKDIKCPNVKYSV
ncbi:hypothetical protein [Streptococcus sp. S784/96/1]|uniref:hypothetical protein n=1 Tax=Streptococcus sp. S784/96/1 TaxID=2653499 RepID=UPI0013873348|nr:hypothetical protein [Streptococcus sp. S784/96/1]